MAETRKEASENSCTASTKKKKMAETEKKIDRLSNLPDDLLYHILSFFPSTKLQVRTSILSKRWRHLWTHSPSLLFPEKINEYDLIVDRCLQLCNAPTLRRVKLWIERRDKHPAAAERVERWLDFAASRSTQELDIEFELTRMDFGQRRPLSLFRCQSLTILRLGNCLLHFRGLFFPSLKSLTLTAANVDEASLNALLSSSPLLQTLELSHIELLPGGILKAIERQLLITHPRLENLTLSYIYHRLKVDSPNLRTFCFSGLFSLLSLAHAPLLHSAMLLDFKPILISLSMICRRNQIFSAISKAEILYIDSNQMCQGQEGCLGKDHQSLLGNPGSKFHYLKELNYQVKSGDGFKFVPLLSVLTKCPILENLCIQFSPESLWERRDEEIAEAKWQAVYNNHPSETLKRFELTMKYLKTIRLIRPIYSRYTMVFLDFLLQKAASLKTLVINPVFNRARRERNNKINNWILMVASKGFEVLIKDLDSYVAP